MKIIVLKMTVVLLGLCSFVCAMLGEPVSHFTFVFATFSVLFLALLFKTEDPAQSSRAKAFLNTAMGIGFISAGCYAVCQAFFYHESYLIPLIAASISYSVTLLFTIRSIVIQKRRKANP